MVKTSKKMSPPMSIKIIATLIIILSIWFIIFSVISFTSTLTSESLLQEINDENPKMAEEFQLRFENRGFDYNESTVLSLFIFGSIASLVMSLFVCSLGVLLWKGKNWARITIIVVSFFLAFGSLITILGGDFYSIVDLGVLLFIGIFLLVNKNVKNFIKKK